ncbi:hypothetical protein [Litoreibacter halocynthiae]|uniref:hypothetical protein n=1 Tax=Litoreibacter halocynthiae TaxID=1242689 RepID=UPI0024903304|nr:hypothetical protein [Litoreibacter halocynthiae]
MFKTVLFAGLTTLIATGQLVAGQHFSPNDTELGTVSGGSNDYLFLKSPREGADVTLTIRPVAGQAFPTEIERINPGTSALADELKINWYAQASCSAGIQQLRSAGPGGTSVQNINGSRNAIAGRSNIQSFDMEAVDRVCIRWAKAMIAQCGWPFEPGAGCDFEETFSYDATTPVPRSSPVRISGSCVNSQLPTTDYYGRLTLRCAFE